MFNVLSVFSVVCCGLTCLPACLPDFPRLCGPFQNPPSAPTLSCPFPPSPPPPHHHHHAGDRALGLQSLPVAFGVDTAKWICVGSIDATQVGPAAAASSELTVACSWLMLIMCRSSSW